ncbi:MAG: glycosyltransferase [Acidimicrobiales bacterium]
MPLAEIAYLVPIGILGVIRWLCWFVRRFPAVFYRPFTTGFSQPLTVVVPVYQEDPVMFRRALRSWLINPVFEVILVIDITDRACATIAAQAAARLRGRVRVIETDVPGKRDALCKGWNAARTPLVALVDSDTVWADDVCRLVCEPFADPRVGGVGTRQNVYSPHGLWQRLADWYLDARYFDEIAGQTVLGQAVSCLSGRTAVYRRRILLAIQDDFMNERFMGVPCMSGDDKRLTSLTIAAGHRTVLQRSARVWSTFPSQTRVFFRQRVRWARNTWRSDLRALFGGWVWRHPFLAFGMIDKAASSITLLVSAAFMILAIAGGHWATVGILGGWWLLSRSVKALPHLERRPADVVLIPAFILVSFLMALVKLWALATVRTQRWLTRQVAVVDGQVVRTGPAS